MDLVIVDEWDLWKEFLSEGEKVGLELVSIFEKMKMRPMQFFGTPTMPMI